MIVTSFVIGLYLIDIMLTFDPLGTHGLSTLVLACIFILGLIPLHYILKLGDIVQYFNICVIFLVIPFIFFTMGFFTFLLIHVPEDILINPLFWLLYSIILSFNIFVVRIFNPWRISKLAKEYIMRRVSTSNKNKGY